MLDAHSGHLSKEGKSSIGFTIPLMFHILIPTLTSTTCLGEKFLMKRENP